MYIHSLSPKICSSKIYILVWKFEPFKVITEDIPLTLASNIRRKYAFLFRVSKHRRKIYISLTLASNIFDANIRSYFSRIGLYFCAQVGRTFLFPFTIIRNKTFMSNFSNDHVPSDGSLFWCSRQADIYPVHLFPSS